MYPCFCAHRPRQFQSGPPTNNNEMVQMLINHGSISTKSVIDAFKAVDRGFFIDAPSDARAGEEVRFLNTCAARPARTPWIFCGALSPSHTAPPQKSAPFITAGPSATASST